MVSSVKVMYCNSVTNFSLQKMASKKLISPRPSAELYSKEYVFEYEGDLYKAPYKIVTGIFVELKNSLAALICIDVQTVHVLCYSYTDISTELGITSVHYCCLSILALSNFPLKIHVWK